jgi:AcrR family transcriptional regulator
MISRRDHRRQQTIDEIKDTARSQLAGAGPAGISMRAIARHLAMTASAVHYYFPSHQALLDALVVDAFTSWGRPCGLPTRGRAGGCRVNSGSPCAGPTGPGP